MFNWFVSIFTIASLAILFFTWMRAMRVKESVGDALLKEWALVRAMVFVAFVCELVLLIFALIGLRVTFAYLSSIYLVYFSVVLYYVVKFFVQALEGEKAPTIEEMPPEPSGE